MTVHLDVDVDLDERSVRAARDAAEAGSGLWLLLTHALARIEAGSATLPRQDSPERPCTVTGPDPVLDLEHWTCLEHKVRAETKDGAWLCPYGGGRRPDPSAVAAEGAIVLELDPTTLVENQPVHLTFRDDSYVGRIEIGRDGTVRLRDDLVSTYILVWTPDEGRTAGVRGLRPVTSGEMRFVGVPRSYV